MPDGYHPQGYWLLTGLWLAVLAPISALGAILRGARRTPLWVVLPIMAVPVFVLSAWGGPLGSYPVGQPELEWPIWLQVAGYSLAYVIAPLAIAEAVVFLFGKRRASKGSS
ncbi:MAG TPA: hypothetical protein VD978_08300 [Azospirillum sp.]|nr:hypothetical protein [Azospirillum sp.]